jgi:hypothetical protein
LDRLGELTPFSQYLVADETLTVTVALVVVSVKLDVPTEATVPVSLTRGMATHSALTAFVPAWVPISRTFSPANTLDRLGELIPLSRYLVAGETLTVTVALVGVGQKFGARVVVAPVSVKLDVPTEATVPVALSSGMTTEVALTVPLPARVPVTSTVSPTWTLDRLGELTPFSQYLVADETSTVMVAPAVVSVKLEVPTEATVPVPEPRPWWKRNDMSLLWWLAGIGEAPDVETAAGMTHSMPTARPAQPAHSASRDDLLAKNPLEAPPGGLSPAPPVVDRRDT